MINSYKIHKIVEYIKLFEFNFEVDEVKEDLKNILNHYDILDGMNTDEMKIVSDELVKLAEQFEFSESARLAFQEDLF